MPKLFERELIWNSHYGIGFCPSPLIEYNGDYFDKYAALDASAIGDGLTRARVEMVLRHMPLPHDLVDIGIGAGAFVRAMKRAGSTRHCRGYDVCQPACAWLKAEQIWCNPYTAPDHGVNAMTFWDSLEHIADPEMLLAKVKNFAFVSMPIYAGEDHCRSSKHFKPGEHVWYFTRLGLITWMDRIGFDCVEVNDIETELGREDVMSFAFRRRTVL